MKKTCKLESPHSFHRSRKAYNNKGLLWGVMYGEWYGVCDFVVLSVVEVCVDYGGVNVFYVCLDFCVVYGVGFVSMSVVLFVPYVWVL